jgi:aryl-alcohol dehydrogenase-like predicted oxidoreductase
MLDKFVELGGNTIDTAHVYGGGNCEKAVGQWVRERGNRDRMVIIGKGAHPPNCTVEGINRELAETLDRLQTDYLDIYFMHRDNLDVPVGEFVECLNEHQRAGRIRAFGGSNWTIERIAEANAYATSNGLTPFTVNSPNFSLAVWNQPTWAGCCAAVDPASIDFHRRTHLALFAWSSQASGFFTGRFKPGDARKPKLKNMVDTWFNPDNFKRLNRARRLAREKGVTSTQIGLAYVLNYPLNIFALIGPRSIEELTSSMQALNVVLTPDELKWLNLEIRTRPRPRNLSAASPSAT